MIETIGVYIGAGVVALVVLTVGLLALFKAFYIKVEQGKVLVVNRIASTAVSWYGGLVLPVIHKAEIMDISLKTIEIDRRGKDGLICKDNIRADIKVTFFVRVNQTVESVLQVASSVGCERASHHETVEHLFEAKFSEALKTVGYNMDFVALYNQRDVFKTQIIKVIGEDLNGYHLEDAAIDYLEQTPVTSLDENNILDANGIRQITELTVDQHVKTNERRNYEKQEITRQNVETEQRVLNLERQREEARASQQREVENIQAQAKADILVQQNAQTQRAESARIKKEEAISLEDVERMRKVEVAEKGRERAVLVEQERVLKDKNLEQIERERQETLKTIQKEKEVEQEKKEIADIVRDRTAVERNVAEEEERTKDLRAFMTAERSKKVVIVGAEAQAEEALVKDIKAAEAKERAATHLAKEQVISAEADLEAADKETRARIRRSEGVQAETAAPGLGQVKVKEADAVAREKLGMVDVKVKEADAAAIEKVGLAEAKVLSEKMLAEAKGIEEQGMAKVRISDGDAAVIQKRGIAEAVAIKEKFLAEAAGLTEKAEAMKALDASSREHEEFRLRLGVEEKLQKEAINANKEIAQAQATTLGEALKNTKIDIVGGDGDFFQRFVNAVGWGKTVDGFVNKSQTSQAALRGYLDGSESLPGDVREILSRPSIDADDLQKLTIAAALGTLMRNGSKSKEVRALLEKAKELGIETLALGGNKADPG